MRNISIVVACLCLANSANGQLSQVANPDDAGFDPGRLERIGVAVERAIDAREIPGAVVLIARNGTIAYFESFGFANVAARKPMRNDSIFRVASMTKAITTVGVMMLYERGYFLLSDPISKYIPGFAEPAVVIDVDDAGRVLKSRPAAREIRILDLLTHTSGIAYPLVPSRMNKAYIRAGIIDGFTSKPVDLESIVLRIAQQPLLFDPGSDFAYGLSTDVLGYLIEVVTGRSLDEFFRTEIFAPLDMRDTHFYLPPAKAHRLVTLYADPDGNGISPARGDEGDIPLDNPNYPIEGAKTYFSGGAGLSSTIVDYARFLQMLLNNGVFDGKRLVSRKSVELMRTARADRDGDGDPDFSLGFRVVNTLDEHTELSTPGAYSWGGAFYTYYWVDPEESLFVLFMSQVRPVQSNIRDLVNVLAYQALH